MFNCIWLENGDAGWEYICSFRNQRLFISGWQCVSVIQCMQCSQIMSSNLLKCMYYTLYNQRELSTGLFICCITLYPVLYYFMNHMHMKSISFFMSKLHIHSRFKEITHPFSSVFKHYFNPPLSINLHLNLKGLKIPCLFCVRNPPSNLNVW